MGRDWRQSFGYVIEPSFIHLRGVEEETWISSSTAFNKHTLCCQRISQWRNFFILSVYAYNFGVWCDTFSMLKSKKKKNELIFFDL